MKLIVARSQIYTASSNQVQMAGIYIHIPFCRKACHYCNFHFSTSLGKAEAMETSILKEIALRSSELEEEVQTIYFGGGTPSIMAPATIDKMLQTLQAHYSISSNPEVTLEANPDDITAEKAKAWKQMGINRFSIGVQSFADENLQWMNRAHDASQSMDCIQIIREAGFQHFSIDLIYGTPGQTQQGWIKDLEKAIELKIPHLSCYALTVEEGTALHHMIGSGKKQKISADEQAERFEALVQLSTKAGYIHYEISNLAMPGKESKHNSAYWEGKPYLGFGPSAHSFSGTKRSWNIADNLKYIQSIEAGILPREEETLREIDQLNEYIMTSLRSIKGMQKGVIETRWGMDKLQIISKEIEQFIRSGKIMATENAWVLTGEGRFFADGIASSLFFLED
jgi:oxygen-independent coproporphyrinogen-3 oxidase